jgi:hypothetical protein
VDHFDRVQRNVVLRERALRWWYNFLIVLFITGSATAALIGLMTIIYVGSIYF